MRIKYKAQKFQSDAANAVVRAFEGQPHLSEEERMTAGATLSGGLFDQVYGNGDLLISEEVFTSNIRSIQNEQGLEPEAEENIKSAVLPEAEEKTKPAVLTVEMETGTGKTFTYTKTMYELHRAYGWSKFIIVVPSVAIREGVLSSLKSMEEHFRAEYGEVMSHFVYNSARLEQIQAFATMPGLQVMVINMQAFNSSLNKKRRKTNKAANIIFSEQDRFGSRKPIEVLAQTRPIMIIDEPQSVLGNSKKSATRQGLTAFKPLAMLLYSATHREIHNLVYRLDALDAYRMELVKQIEVKGLSQSGLTGTDGYIGLENIIPGKGGAAPTARITYDKMVGNAVCRKTNILREGDDLFRKSKELQAYRDGYVIESIDGTNGGRVTLRNGKVIGVGLALGDRSDENFRRVQIRETIKSHIEKEERLYHMGIKVLSLFFIDRVSNYRIYEKGVESNGSYADIFEEEYTEQVKIIKKKLPVENPYRRYLERSLAHEVHNGYFSQDKKTKHFIDSKTMGSEGNSDDESAYDLIMRDKERLLSLDEPTRFIFSHSALKEGWDNPNVFQICTLREPGQSMISRRQQVGRGMRLAVNQQGVRQDRETTNGHTFDINVLTVIAGEEYGTFAAGLQEEISETIKHRPLCVTVDLFEGRSYTDINGQKKIDKCLANKIPLLLYNKGYIDENSKLTDNYYHAVTDDSFTLGKNLCDGIREVVLQVLQSVFSGDELKPINADTRSVAKYKKENFKEFSKLWDKIKTKSYYTVNFDSNTLIEKAVKELNDTLIVSSYGITVTKAEVCLDELHSGKRVSEQAIGYSQSSISPKYDLPGELMERTGLTRKTIVAILKKISNVTFGKYANNPEEFIRKSATIINAVKGDTIIPGITYTQSSDTFQESIFEEACMRGYIGKNAIKSTKSLYDLIVVDSEGVEMRFAQDLEVNSAVLVYTKLPGAFYIHTPVGNYNPDWAIVFRDENMTHVYFIAETKGSLVSQQRRDIENAKIECARKHFETISKGAVQYHVVRTFDDLKKTI